MAGKQWVQGSLKHRRVQLENGHPSKSFSLDAVGERGSEMTWLRRFHRHLNVRETCPPRDEHPPEVLALERSEQEWSGQLAELDSLLPLSIDQTELQVVRALIEEQLQAGARRSFARLNVIRRRFVPNA